MKSYFKLYKSIVGLLLEYEVVAGPLHLNNEHIEQGGSKFTISICLPGQQSARISQDICSAYGEDTKAKRCNLA